MPWELLGLSEDTATEKDIKRAYAQRLKVTRPDRDPAGFKELHDAYQLALHLIQNRGSAAQVSRLENLHVEEETLTQNVVSLPSHSIAEDTIHAACDALEDSIRNSKTSIAEEIRAVEEALYCHPEAVSRWGASVAALIEKYPCHPELVFKPKVLLFEISHQSADLTFAIINRLDKMGKHASINGISQNFLSAAEQMKTPLGAMVYVRLATSAAMWELPIVDHLANAAYLQLAPRERDYYMDMIDQFKRVGPFLSGVPDVWKRFWAIHLLGHSRQDWSDEESSAALNELSRSRSKVWPCYKEIIELLPSEIVETLPARAEEAKKHLLNKPPVMSPQSQKTWQYEVPKSAQDHRQKSQHERRRRVVTRSEEPSFRMVRSEGLPTQAWIWIILFTLKIIFLLSKCESN